MTISFLSALRWFVANPRDPRRLLLPLLSAAALLFAAAPQARAQTTFPSAQVGVAYSHQITTNPAAAAGTVYSITNLPAGLGIGSSTGLISGTPTTAGTSSGVLSLTSNSITNNYNYTLTVTGAANTPTITSATSVSGTVAAASSNYQITTNSASTILSYTVSGLPPGLTANTSTGVISGTPTTAGTYSATVSATNSTGTGSPATVTFTIAAAAGAPAITNAAPLSISGTVGTAITPYQVTASNSPTSFAATGLPLGLTINASTGVISGTPQVNGVSTVSLTASNANVGAATTLTVTIGAFSSITSASTASGTQSSAFSFSLTANNSPTSYNVSGLPSGLLASSAGVISGTPTVAGTFALTVSANNALGTGPASTLTLTLAAPSGGGTSLVTPTINTSPVAATTTVGGTASFVVSATANGAVLSYQWLFNGTVISGQTNSTLNLSNVQTSAAGSYSVVVTSTGGGGSVSITTIGVPLTVNPAVVVITPPSITTQPLSQTVTAGSGVTFSVAATGSSSLTYQWYKNGTPIGGAVSASLTLSNVSAADAASYTVGVSSGASTVTSSAAILTVTTPTPTAVPPTITTQPVSQTVTAGASVTFSVAANASSPLTYQWSINGSPIAGATLANLNLTSVSLGDAASYTVTVTSAGLSVTSNAAVLTVNAAPPAPTLPTITTQPAAQTAVAGSNVTFSVTAAGTGSLTYQWAKNGTAITGANSANLTLTGVSSSDAASYTVTVSNGSLAVVSNAATLTVMPLPPTVTTQPASQTGVAGSSVTFSAAATGSSGLTYQWAKNGTPISGATSANLTLTGISASDAATYTVTIANAGVSVVSNGAVLTVTPAPFARLVNVSISGYSGAVPQNLVVGLTIGGSGSKNVLVRAVGPTLGTFGVPGVMTDPQLTMISSGTQVAFNDDWGGGSALSTAFAQTGAFGLPVASKDAAALLTLNSGASYTANVSGGGGSSGVVLLEAYDADTAAAPAAKFVNLSARGTAGSGSNVMTIGFVILGNANKTILLRGIGPTLAAFGVPGALSSTQLTLFGSTGTILNTNAGWGGTTVLTAAFSAVNAFALSPTSADSALLVTLAPGTYTAQLTAAGPSTAAGVALLELYDENP